MAENRKFDFHSERTGTALSVRVVPRAKTAQIAEIRADGCVVIRLTCDTVDKPSHRELLAFLAKILSVDPARLEVVVGDSGDYKIISIIGMDAKTVDDQLRMVKKVPD